jgi:hypothetical protein
MRNKLFPVLNWKIQSEIMNHKFKLSNNEKDVILWLI